MRKWTTLNPKFHAKQPPAQQDGIQASCIQQQQQQHSLFSQASWGRLEMKPERNKFKVQAH